MREILVRVETQSRPPGQDLVMDWGYQEGKGGDSQIPIYSLGGWREGFQKGVSFEKMSGWNLGDILVEVQRGGWDRGSGVQRSLEH